MMSKYKSRGFVGVISADEIPDLIEPTQNLDKFGFVMNTDDSDEAGEHWVSCYVDLVDDCSVEYYDSYADPPSERFLQDIKQLIDAHGVDHYLKMKSNKIKHQDERSSLCGFHAMRFLIDRFEGKPFIDASGFTEVRKYEGIAKQMLDKYDKNSIYKNIFFPYIQHKHNDEQRGG